MSSPSSVAVVIACHSERRWEGICAAISSVHEQTYPAATVILAVDHNPALADRLRQERPDVRVTENCGGTRGASATRNAGAALSHAEITAFLDDDETAWPSWLDALLTPFASTTVVGTGGSYRPHWLVGKPAWFPDEFAWVVGGSYTGMPTTTTRVRNVWSGNMAVRTSAFRSVGGFREGFGKVAGQSRPEDTDLCIRMAAASGGTWIYVPSAGIDHEVPADRSTFSFFLRRSFAEGRGKVELRSQIPADDVLATESDFLRRTIPNGIRMHVRAGWPGRVRAAALVMGCGAAGAGAVTALARPGRRPLARATTDRQLSAATQDAAA